jgi:hypothetical protein
MNMPDVLPPGTKLGNLLIEKPCGADGSGRLYTAVILPVKLRALVRVLPAKITENRDFFDYMMARLKKYGTIRNEHLAQMVAFDQTAAIQKWLIVTSLGDVISLKDKLAKNDLTPPWPSPSSSRPSPPCTVHTSTNLCTAISA